MNSQKSPYLCFCNKVSESAVIECIKKGARNLAEIYDACSAGNGPCGGSCRNKILNLLKEDSVSSVPNKSVDSEENMVPIPDELIEAVSLFNRRYYWETHEVLEGLWMHEHGKPRLFYQGIIQASAALYHVLNANPKGVIKLAEESIKKLQPYSPKYMEIEIDSLVHTMEDYIQQAKDILGQLRPGFNYDQLPYLRLGSIMEEHRPEP